MLSQMGGQFTEEDVQDALNNLSPVERTAFEQLYAASHRLCLSSTPNLKLFMANAFETSGPVESGVYELSSRPPVVRVLLVSNSGELCLFLSRFDVGSFSEKFEIYFTLNSPPLC